MVMLKLNERGEINPLTLPFAIVMILALGFGVFGVWAYSSYNDQKSNVDVIVAVEVVEAEKNKEAELQAEFAEEQKKPNKTYTGPVALGSVKIVYPKSWSAYIQAQETGTVKLEAYFHPDYVPSTDSDVLYATRVSLSRSDYAKVLASYQDLVEDGDLSAKAITISGAKGTRLNGLIERDVNGALVLLPLRDKTLMIWTESTNYIADFNKIISNLTYSP